MVVQPTNITGGHHPACFTFNDCGWLRNPAPVDGLSHYLSHNFGGVSIIQGGAGFLP